MDCTLLITIHILLSTLINYILVITLFASWIISLKLLYLFYSTFIYFFVETRRENPVTGRMWISQDKNIAISTKNSTQLKQQSHMLKEQEAMHPEGFK